MHYGTLVTFFFDGHLRTPPEQPYAGKNNIFIDLMNGLGPFRHRQNLRQ